MKSAPFRVVTRVFLLLVACLAGMAQTTPNFLLFTDPGERFSVEFPKDWRWMIVSGSGEPVATFIHPRSEAAVVVERFRMKQPLSPADVTDLFAEIEAEYVKENQPKATVVTSRVMGRGGAPSAVIDYNRPGLGEQERVRQYSVPVGQNLYRITCMALASRFAMYEADFNAVVLTLKAAGDLKVPAGQPRGR